MKKLLNISLVILLCAMSFTSVIADDYDFSDTEYWDEYCVDYRTSGAGSEKFTACAAYQRYKIESSQDRIEDLTQQIEDLEGNLEEAQRLMEQYNAEIEALSVDIENKQIEIENLQADIDYLQDDIDVQEAEVNVLNERVLDRMAAGQSTMHFNAYLDFLLGASSFEDLLRRGYGLETIMQADEEIRNDILAVLTDLNDKKAALDESKSLLDLQLSSLEQSQNDLATMVAFQQEVYDETNALIDETLASLEEEYQNYADLVSAADLEGIPNSEGFINPAQGAEISAGTWYYPESFGGGVHLGADFAVGIGTELVAPASGVVIVSSDGCPTGYLGDSCGSADGGVVYGGNQIYLIVSAGGNIYGITFCHLLAGSLLVEEGDIVVQGQAIAQVGSSGNSTGPHCHIELFYLGEGNITDIPSYLERNYTLSFNCGWGSAALNRLCENGVGAPCRLKPENYLA